MAMKNRVINEGERNGKKRVLFMIIFSCFLLLGSAFVFAASPYLNTLPIYEKVSRTYTPSLITETTELEDDGSLLLNNKNKYEKEEKLRLSSTNTNTHIGDYHTSKFIYGDVDGASSNITLSFTVEEVEIKDVKFDISVCKVDGTSVTKLKEEDYIFQDTLNEFVAIINRTSDIYISTITITYFLRVK